MEKRLRPINNTDLAAEFSEVTKTENQKRQRAGKKNWVGRPQGYAAMTSICRQHDINLAAFRVTVGDVSTMW